MRLGGEEEEQWERFGCTEQAQSVLWSGTLAQVQRRHGGAPGIEKAHGTNSHGTEQAVQIYDPAATITYDRLINASDTDNKCPASIISPLNRTIMNP